MKRTVLVNGKEVDLREMIPEPKGSLNRVFGDNSVLDSETEEHLDPEIEKLTIILEISIRSQFKNRL